jgi:hypothetical protein
MKKKVDSIGIDEVSDGRKGIPANVRITIMERMGTAKRMLFGRLEIAASSGCVDSFSLSDIVSPCLFNRGVFHIILASEGRRERVPGIFARRWFSTAPRAA